MATQKFNFVKFFLIHTDITAVTIQANKIISNEVKDKAPLEPSHGKKNECFGQPNRKMCVNGAFPIYVQEASGKHNNVQLEWL